MGQRILAAIKIIIDSFLSSGFGGYFRKKDSQMQNQKGSIWL